MDVMSLVKFVYGDRIIIWFICLCSCLSLFSPWLPPKNEELNSYKSPRRLRWALCFGFALAIDTAVLCLDPYIWWGMGMAVFMTLWFPGFYIICAKEFEVQESPTVASHKA
jgi:hypothetical protein